MIQKNNTICIQVKKLNGFIIYEEQFQAVEKLK